MGLFQVKIKGCSKWMPIKEKLSINNKLSVTYLVEMKAFTACRHGQMKSPAEMIFRFLSHHDACKQINLVTLLYLSLTNDVLHVFKGFKLADNFMVFVNSYFSIWSSTWQNELHSIVKIAIYDGVQFEKSLRSSILDRQMIQKFGRMVKWARKKNFYDFLKSKWLINSITEIVKIRDNSKDLNCINIILRGKPRSNWSNGRHPSVPFYVINNLYVLFSKILFAAMKKKLYNRYNLDEKRDFLNFWI